MSPLSQWFILNPHYHDYCKSWLKWFNHCIKWFNHCKSSTWLFCLTKKNDLKSMTWINALIGWLFNPAQSSCALIGRLFNPAQSSCALIGRLFYQILLQNSLPFCFSELWNVLCLVKLVKHELSLHSTVCELEIGAIWYLSVYLLQNQQSRTWLTVNLIPSGLTKVRMWHNKKLEQTETPWKPR